MDHLKQRLAMLHDDMTRLLKEAKGGRAALDVSDLKAVLKVARDLETFAIAQIALREQDAKKRR